MSGRKQRIDAEAEALWRELYGEAPPADADGSAILDAMLRQMPAVEYEQLNSPHLRRSALTFPKRAR